MAPVRNMGSLALETRGGFRPPAPVPRAETLGLIALLKALRNNPLEAWTRAHFEKPVVPGAIRRVLLDNAGNYRKDSLQRRMLSAVLNNGLLTAEAEQWRAQRRTLAPMFAKRCVMSFAPAMLRAAEALVERWRRRREGDLVDVATEVTG